MGELCPWIVRKDGSTMAAFADIDEAVAWMRTQVSTNGDEWSIKYFSG